MTPRTWHGFWKRRWSSEERFFTWIILASVFDQFPGRHDVLDGHPIRLKEVADQPPMTLPEKSLGTHKVQYNEAVARLLAHVVDGDNAMMLQLGNPASFADALQGRDFHGDWALEGSVQRTPNLPGAALGQSHSSDGSLGSTAISPLKDWSTSTASR